MAPKFTNDWKALLDPEFQKDYYKQLHNFLAQEYRSRTIYPDMYEIFSTLQCTAYSDVKVVILGQDPYHGPGQASPGSHSPWTCVRMRPLSSRMAYTLSSASAAGHNAHKNRKHRMKNAKPFLILLSPYV